MTAGQPQDRDERILRELTETMARVLDISFAAAAFAIRKVLNVPPRPAPVSAGEPKENA